MQQCVKSELIIMLKIAVLGLNLKNTKAKTL